MFFEIRYINLKVSKYFKIVLHQDINKLLQDIFFFSQVIIYFLPDINFFSRVVFLILNARDFF